LLIGLRQMRRSGDSNACGGRQRLEQKCADTKWQLSQLLFTTFAVNYLVTQSMLVLGITVACCVLCSGH